MKRYILAVMFLASFIAAEDIGLKFRLEPYDNISPKENISFFVPFAKGVLTGNEDILLAFPGLKIFPQKKIICSWDDKSVRVLELSLAGLEGRTTLEGVIYWGNLEKQKKEAEEKEKKAAGPDLTKKIPVGTHAFSFSVYDYQKIHTTYTLGLKIES
ncbi:MAG: hypothetical protein A2231_05780 [Candidatus Firestonebacteria bacterium RIFOXYA2_FULL_40_8]|nr:MAG: hypothetical protein A2231_05780 [Candidatus Firestonebacteria bacterium RIFOXYA2_FULL_40_8]